MAHTPPVKDAQGREIPGAVASLEKVRIGGSEQWIVIRGHSAELPLLLFLSGGPGGSELGWFRHYQGPLEAQYLTVVWEQRGTGKSYKAGRGQKLHIQQFVSDIIELTEYLCQRFGQRNICLMGHSWGTLLGILAIRQRPDLYRAYVGSGQMVSATEGDRHTYQYVREALAVRGWTWLVKLLDVWGPPPYAGGRELYKYGLIVGLEMWISEQLCDQMAPVSGYDGLSLLRKGFFIPEYTWADRLGLLLGALKGSRDMYPQMLEYNFFEQAKHLEVPVYFLQGRHDHNTPGVIAAAYFQALDAPRKTFVWFETSAHSPQYRDSEAFNRFMLDTVLRESSPGVYLP